MFRFASGQLTGIDITSVHDVLAGQQVLLIQVTVVRIRARILITL
jgi:hypothetical protein